MNPIEEFYKRMELPLFSDEFEKFEEYQNFDFYESEEGNKHYVWKGYEL